MWSNLRHWWIESLFGPRRKTMFALRIRLRLLRLHFRLWRRSPKAPAIRHHWPKPLALLFVGILVPAATVWLLSILFPTEARGFATAVHNLLTKPDEFRLEWREAAQVLLILVGIPSAFLLWLFRDINISGTLENQRKDVNLKEFHEIQLRAAGALDEKLPAAARETLQIAALHQLRLFLRGEYGDSFRRPAFELLRARLVASAHAIGMDAVAEQIHEFQTANREKLRQGRGFSEIVEEHLAEVFADLQNNPVSETERVIVQEEWQAIFRSSLPLRGSKFDGICLQNGELLSEINVAGCRFLDVSFHRIHLERANMANANFANAQMGESRLEFARISGAGFFGATLANAHLERADLGMANLQAADLSNACLDYANLVMAILSGACLRHISLIGAILVYADLSGADLSGADLKEADLEHAFLTGADLELIDPRVIKSCQGARFDAFTRFKPHWNSLSEAEKQQARRPWLERGATMAAV